MFELAFILGITAVGIIITVWMLRRGAKNEGTCSGCAFHNKGIPKELGKRREN